jgi:pimeloyl-ACP methyl ester carboxylesterase
MSDELTVTLLPGLDGTGKLFDRFVSRCPRGFSPQVISYPGDRPLDYPELETFVHERLPRDRPFVIVGESFSGPLAVILASRSIPNLQAVVLVASFVTPPAFHVWRVLPWGLLFRFSVPVSMLRALFPGSDAALACEMRGAVRTVASGVLAARVRSTMSVDVRGHLARTTCPLLYIQATRDLVVPRRCLGKILSVRQDVIVERLDSHHPVLQLRPEHAWEAIERFLCGVRAEREAADDDPACHGPGIEWWRV